MPRRDIDDEHLLRLRRWVIHRHEDGWTTWKICRERRLPQSTVHRWLRWGEEGRELTNRKAGRKPGNRPVTDAPEVVHEVAVMRSSWGWGPRKIVRVLGKDGRRVAEGIVYSIVKRNGLNVPLNKPRKKHDYIRFEREHSNSMWQTDYKQIDADNRLTAYIDDHSRFVLGATIVDSPTTATAIRLFEECISEWGKPREILTGHDAQYYAMRGGKSQFDARLEELGINRALASKELKRLTEGGRVKSELRHVFGTKRQKKTYVLTNLGERLAAELKQIAAGEVTELREGGVGGRPDGIRVLARKQATDR